MQRKTPRNKLNHRYAVTVFDTLTGQNYCVLANSLDEIVNSTLFAVDKLKEKEREWQTKNSNS